MVMKFVDKSRDALLVQEYKGFEKTDHSFFFWILCINPLPAQYRLPRLLSSLFKTTEVSILIYILW